MQIMFIPCLIFHKSEKSGGCVVMVGLGGAKRITGHFLTEQLTSAYHFLKGHCL